MRKKYGCDVEPEEARNLLGISCGLSFYSGHALYPSAAFSAYRIIRLFLAI